MGNTSWTAEMERYGPSAPPTRRPTLPAARAYCRTLARHYENFSLVSWLLPRHFHQHVYNIYAYCRWADDLADEIEDPQYSVQLLHWWRDQLDACYCGQVDHPVFVALAETIRQFSIPKQPFRDLLAAFLRDQHQQRYATFEELLDYCRCSANPVGRLVLYLAGSATQACFERSDSICTGLQLANFCQDVARDWQRGRIYLPQETCRRFGYEEADFAARSANDAFRQVLRTEVDRAEAHLLAGRPLLDLISPEFRFQVDLFLRGGLAVLEQIRRQNYDVWADRPTVGRWQKVRLVLTAHRQKRRRAGGPPLAAYTSSIGESYRHCQHVARRAASSFYWSFWLLPPAKRRAMCALYAFSRKTDDLADNDLPEEVRRHAIRGWRSSLQRALAGEFDDPIWPSLIDTVNRFGVPPEHLFAIVDGVAMDLDVCRYESFDDLQHYCDHVAVAVGLVCLHIWGFRDPRACDLARPCGTAMQMTNILRDLREDSQQGRVYLPAEDLRRFGYTVEELQRGVVNERFRALMQFEIDRTERLFDESFGILRHLHTDGRRACSVMLATYRSLLRQIRDRGGDVLSRPVRQSRWKKLAVVLLALLGRTG